MIYNIIMTRATERLKQWLTNMNDWTWKNTAKMTRTTT